MKREWNKETKRLAFCSGIILLALLLGIYACVHLAVLKGRMAAAPERAGSPDENAATGRAAVYADGKAYVLRDNLSTLLLIGTDADGGQESSHSYNNQQQADFLMLLVLDRNEDLCTAIQLNRDTMTNIPILSVDGRRVGDTRAQLALAHTYGDGLEKSCENTVEAVSRLLYGAEIDRYFCITMDAVPVINDLLGGITVAVADDFSALDGTLEKGETIRLTGEQALTFVRARGGMADSSNTARMNRQWTYLEALGAELKTQYSSNPGLIGDLCKSISGQTVTNCSIAELEDMARTFHAVRLLKYTPEGETKRGQTFLEFYPDEELLRRLVLQVFYMQADT